MLIAGSFREYPFFLLLEIFLRRRETGLLEVSSTEESGYFYIKNGKVKDGQVGKSKGLAAVKLVGKFSDGSFRFKPLAPTDYARVVWQRSFGPTGLATDQPTISASAIRNKLSQFRSNSAAAYRVSNPLGSSAARALRQFLLYTSTACHGIQRIGLFLPRRTVACAVAGSAFWKSAQVGTRLLFPIATIKNFPIAIIKNKLGHLHSCISAALFLIQRTGACVTSGFALWKRAQVGTRLLRILKTGFAALQDKRRRDRQLKPKYPREASLQVALPTIPKRAVIASALQQGVEHNVIFALIVTVLLGVSGVMLYQLLFVNPHSIETGITVDEHFNTEDIPARATRPRAKPKRQGSKRPSTDKSTDKKRRVGSTQEPGAVPQTAPIRTSEYDLRDDGAVPKSMSETTSEVHSIPAVLQVENGRVSQASQLNRLSGIENLEPAALQLLASAGISWLKHTNNLSEG